MSKQNRASIHFGPLQSCLVVGISYSRRVSPKFQSPKYISRSHSPPFTTFFSKQRTRRPVSSVLPHHPQLILLDSSKFLSFMYRGQTFGAPSFSVCPSIKVSGFFIDRWKDTCTRWWDRGSLPLWVSVTEGDCLNPSSLKLWSKVLDCAALWLFGLFWRFGIELRLSSAFVFMEIFLFTLFRPFL